MDYSSGCRNRRNFKKQNMLSEVERADTHKDFQALGKGANRLLQRPLHVMKINDLFYLVDRTHKGLIRTFDLNHKTDASFGKVVSNKTNMFTDPEFSSAVDAHFTQVKCTITIKMSIN